MKVQKIMKPFLITPLFVGALTCATSPLLAAPAIWESDFGTELTSLSGTDDREVLQALSFSFDFAGTEYDRMWIGTNGAVQFDDANENGPGNTGDIDYDIWDDMDEFLDDGFPIVAPLNTDWDPGEGGNVYFNDFGDRAVVTWDEVAAYENNDVFASFQAQFFDNGTIIFGYNGILDSLGDDLVGDLGEGLLVGLALGDGTDPGTSDLSAGLFGGGTTTIFELWCYDEVDSCDGQSGPTNDAFDLDMTNLIFTQNKVGGYDVTSQLAAAPVPLPASVLLLGGALFGLGALRKTKI